MMSDMPLLRVDGLRVDYPGPRGESVRAVDDVSFTVRRGETFGLVGESGCGKSTLGRAVLRLIEPTGGSVQFNGEDMGAWSARTLRQNRRKFQMIFQDPHTSLNPRLTVRHILEEPLRAQGMRRAARKARILELADAVGLPAGALDRYAHEFSGGQRQRIGIARALAPEPDFIAADEPVAALDVSIQAQILNLLMDVKQAYGLTLLFIAHDLSVVEYVSDRVGVMLLGKLVECAPAEALYRDPLHPYTRSLLDAVPAPDPDHKRSRMSLSGEPPDPAHPPAGCSFHTRCPLAETVCGVETPPLREIRPGHQSACHFS